MQGDPPAEFTYGMKYPIVKDEDQPEWWTSVARTAVSARGLNENHHVRVVFDTLDLAKLCELYYSTNPALLKVEGDGFAEGGTLTKKDTLLKITGLPAAPDIQTVEVQVRIKSTHQVLQTLKVLVMPERKVRLRVLFVEDHTTENLSPVDPPRYSSSVPSSYKDFPASVQKLNEVYRQNCLTFVADADSGPLAVNYWDRYSDGILDCVSPWNEYPTISDHVTRENELPIVKDRITLQSGALHILVFRKIIAEPEAAGFWMPKFMNNCIFIGAENHENAQATQDQAKAMFLRNCAHEVGHGLGLSVRRSVKLGDLNPLRHDGGIDPVRYGMRPLLADGFDSKDPHPEYTWLRHEEWEPAWTFVKKHYTKP